MKEIKNLTRSIGFEKFDPLSPDEVNKLLDFEKFCMGNLLPSGFKYFISLHNGGSFDECLFLNSPIGPVVVAFFLPVFNDSIESIESSFAYFKEEVTDRAIPFASDPGGNYFLLGFKVENMNKVYFWDHEKNALHVICSSFEEFVNSLVVDD
ncbi:SMI1/KNR4 family protein [Chitinilyticum aquatile]|uniref:SMI1/KNR4 family protein n=1 Tax=Chitinilyticum aquatile TaxID=362520 RepID=UPI0009D63DFB|nr:SMI1/KNR4 family protein [Chitinilyticum aquatile]